MWYRTSFLVVLVLMGAHPGALLAQGLGAIVGTVTDASGAALPGVTVKVIQEETQLSREAISNQQGYYAVLALRPSVYSISAQAPSLPPYKRSGVTLEADQRLTIDIRLSSEESPATVAPAAVPSAVNTTSATVGEVVDQRRMVDLPLNGRNAANLALVVGGVAPAPDTDINQGASKTFPAVVAISTNGARQDQVAYRLDGASNNDIYTNANQPFPFPDAIQEFSVQTSNYPAQYGGKAGGVVNIVTKSGTNSFHGDVFEFNRNAIFNARNTFAASRDPLKRNQFGGVAGGPVTIPHVYNGRNRLFFFTGYQGTTIRTVNNTQSAYVPTQANARGDFSALLDPSSPANPTGKSVAIFDPSTGAAFPGNILPPGKLSPASLAFLKYLPVSAGDSLIFYGLPVRQNFNEITVRADYSISSRDRLTARYFFDRFTNAGYLDSRNYLADSSSSTIPFHNALLSETHIFGPGILNIFRATLSREVSDREPPAASINPRMLGVSIYQPPGVSVLDGITVSGYFSVSQEDPARFARSEYMLSDEFSIVHGRHAIVFGAAGIRGQVIIRNRYMEAGSFGFTADYTGDAMASFMLGKLRSFRQGSGEWRDGLLDTFNLFIQDEFHVHKRLTLNLGLRYDPFFPWAETRGRIEQFRTDAYAAGRTSQVYVNAPPGLLFPGDAGVPPLGYRGAFRNFAPRLGFAYDLTGDGRASLRAGVGTFYDGMQAASSGNTFVDVTPFSTQVTLTDPAGPFDNPYLGLSSPFPARFPPPRNIAFPLPLSAITYDPANNGRFRTPVNYNWNLLLERQLGAAWLVRWAYVGAHSSHLRESIQLSPAVYIPGSTATTDQRRLFRQYGSISQASQDIDSSYNSLQLTVLRRFLNGLSI